jgi:hypothetical protein
VFYIWYKVAYIHSYLKDIVMEASEIRTGIKDLAARVDDIRDWL